MAQPNLLTSTGRTNLENPPKPTTPPEAAPRIAQLTPEDKGASPSIGSMQQAGIVFQTGMAVEKGILALANLIPQFAGLARQIIPQIRKGIQGGLGSGGGGANAGGQAAELPQQSVSPLTQG